MDHFLGIGGLILAVRCADERIVCHWDDPVRRFLTAPATPDLDLSVGVLDPPPAVTGTLLFDSGAVWRLLAVGDSYRIECRSEAFGDTPYKIATFDRAFSRGTIEMREDILQLNPLEYPLDEVMVSQLLGRRRGVELHSCGVVDREGRGRLFVGVSGAGKTTTAGLWRDEAIAIVSDDRVIVREREDGMWMYGTPWHGEAGLSEPSAVPLAGVYLLVQSDTNELRPLTNAAAVAGLFRCSFPQFHDAAAVDYTLEFLTLLVSRVLVMELHFTRDRAAVDAVLEQRP